MIGKISSPDLPFNARRCVWKATVLPVLVMITVCKVLSCFFALVYDIFSEVLPMFCNAEKSAYPVCGVMYHFDFTQSRTSAFLDSQYQLILFTSPFASLSCSRRKYVSERSLICGNTKHFCMLSGSILVVM